MGFVVKRGPINDVAQSSPGRTSARVAGSLRERILAGQIGVGEFLPIERELASEFSLARVTIRRALRMLETEGLVKIEPRRGCRVLPRASDPGKGFPLAHVFVTPSGEWALDGFHQAIQSSIQRAAAQRNWAMLTVPMAGRPPSAVIEQVRAARAWGVILDVVEPRMLQAIRDSGLPAVFVDAWSEDAPFDAVLQNSYQGGFLAARHLIERGHREIAWFGFIDASSFSRERFGGAAAALAAAGLDLPCRLRFDIQGCDRVQVAHDLLSQPDRPKAVLSMWGDTARTLAAVAAEHGLRLGHDLDIVGWSTEEQYETYAASFGKGGVPPTIVWNVGDMARMAIARLADRLAHPELPPMRIDVSTRLLPGRSL